MIVVEARLLSAVDSSRDRMLCRVEIANDGTGTATRANYDVRLYGSHGRRIRTARVDDYARGRWPAWCLVQLAMVALGGEAIKDVLESAATTVINRALGREEKHGR